MPYSFKRGKNEIREILISTLPPETKVLDIGAGSGTYFNLLGDYFPTMDAVEVFAPNIEKFSLQEKYRKVFNQDCLEFSFEEEYGLIIMGDVLEHLRVEDAQDFIKRALDSNPKAQMMIAVPYEHPQHGVGGNTHERHLQEDLNKENFSERYPDFELAILLKSPSKRKEFAGGYYLRKGSFEKPV